MSNQIQNPKQKNQNYSPKPKTKLKNFLIFVCNFLFWILSFGFKPVVYTYIRITEDGEFFSSSNKINVSNPRGVISIAMVLTILAIISAIALGSSFIVSGEVRISSNANESVAALYYAETGIEKAILDVKTGIEPTATRCNPPNYTNWTVVSNIKYCLSVTGLISDGSISKIQSIGQFGSTRRSIEITF